jgi:molecular chaperone GrpE
MSSPEETNAGPVIRDLRRIDPHTGQVRNPGPDAPGTAGRGPGKPARPGKHSVSKPGATSGAGSEAPAQPAPDGGPAAAGPAGSGDRPAGGGAPAAEPAGVPESGGGREAREREQQSERELAARLAERTADLQRVSAEYANYRKRVDRDRLVVREQALANVLIALLPVLDDIGRAREHGELSGGFKSVADSLESTVTKLGLTSFGTEGEPFDPNVHEALMHSYSTEVTEPTCVRILQPGYKVGERIVRPARVAVAEPEDGAGAPDEAGQPGGAGSQESREDED